MPRAFGLLFVFRTKNSGGCARVQVCRPRARRRQPIGACAFSSPSTMPEPSRMRQGKRKRPPEEIISSSSLEILSSVGRGARASKRRAVEKFDFKSPDDDLPPPGSQTDPSDPVGDETVDLSTDLTSRSVSVSVVSVCHVTHQPRHPLTLS